MPPRPAPLPADGCARPAPLAGGSSFIVPFTGLQAGDEAAYEQLIQRFQGPVYNLAWRLLNNPSDASDVVQEVFLKVFRKVDGFRGDCSLKTWIYRIAVHESYNQRRWFRRHRSQETALETADEQSVSYMDVLPDPEGCGTLLCQLKRPKPEQSRHSSGLPPRAAPGRRQKPD